MSVPIGPFSLGARLVALMLSVACGACTQTDANPTAPSAQTPLRGAQWSVVELDGKAIATPTGQRVPTLLLAADGGRANGFAGCNQWSASYTSTGENLRLTGMIMTRMFCAETMDLEKQYTAALESARSYRITNTRLELIADGKVVAAFEKR